MARPIFFSLDIEGLYSGPAPARGPAFNCGFLRRTHKLGPRIREAHIHRIFICPHRSENGRHRYAKPSLMYTLYFSHIFFSLYCSLMKIWFQLISDLNFNFFMDPLIYMTLIYSKPLGPTWTVWGIWDHEEPFLDPLELKLNWTPRISWWYPLRRLNHGNPKIYFSSLGPFNRFSACTTPLTVTLEFL